MSARDTPPLRPGDRVRSGEARGTVIRCEPTLVGGRGAWQGWAIFVDWSRAVPPELRPPHTPEQKRAFSAAWDARVEAGKR